MKTKSITGGMLALANKIQRYPLIQTGDPCDPFLDVVFNYLKCEGDPMDVLGYLERAESIHALPYARAR